MSDTPRTDKEAMANSLNGKMMADEVSADFSRKLELENNRLRENNARLITAFEAVNELAKSFSADVSDAAGRAVLLLPNDKVQTCPPTTKN
jgi:hypothetical protein